MSKFHAALKITKVGNIGVTELNALKVATQGLSDSQLKAVLSSNALSNSQRMAILQSRGMSAAEAQAALSTMGLAASEGVATGATVTLSGALKGLWATMLSNPLLLIGAGIAATVMIFSFIGDQIEEIVSKTNDASNAFGDSLSSIEEQKQKVSELKESLASGMLSEEEAYNAKAELLSIQQELTSSYGEQAAGIDLVNGSLETQLGLMDKLSEQDATKYLNENRKGIDLAKNKMETPEPVTLGTLNFEDSEEGKAIKKIVEKYEDAGIKYDPTGENGVFTVYFEGNTKDAEDTINSFMSDVNELQDSMPDSGFDFSTLLDTSSSSLGDVNKILEDYQEIYDNAMKAEAMTDKTKYKAGDGVEKTASKWMKEYSKAVEAYNDALLEGDNEQISEAKNNFQKFKEEVDSALSDTGMSQYSQLFEEITNQLNEAAISAKDFNDGILGKGEDQKQKKLSKYADRLKKLDLSDVDFQDAVVTDGAQKGEKAIQGIMNLAQKLGFVEDDSAESIKKVTDALVEQGIISGQASEKVAGDYDSLKKKSIDLGVELNNINTLLEGQKTGSSIDIKFLDDDTLKDYASALEYVNGTMQLNEDKVKELTKAKAEEQIAVNDATKAQQQSKYLENAAEIEQLRKKLEENNFAYGESEESVQDHINSILEDNSAIVTQCGQIDLLNSSLRESIGVYQEWLNAQNGSESGDMFDDSLKAMQTIRDTSDEDSDDYGRTGTKKYKAAVDFIVPESVDGDDSAAVQTYMDSIGNLFTYDDDGKRNGLDIGNFCEQAVDKGLLVLDESTNSYKLAGEQTMKSIAKGMNLSLPLVRAMFGEMEEFGAEFDWSDEGVKSLGDLAVEANEAKEALKGLEGNSKLKIDMDISNIEDPEEKVRTLDNTIEEMNALKARPEIDSSSIEQANAVIQYCVAQKQQLSEPSIMKVDTRLVSSEVGDAVSLLQQFQEAQNTVELQKSIGVDTTEAQEEVNALVQEIQGLNPNVKADLKIDTTNLDTINQSLAKLPPELLVHAGIDESAILGYNPENKDAKVVYEVDDTQVTQYNPPNLERKVTYTIEQQGTPPSGSSGGKNKEEGTHGLNGTAHASGTAKMQHAYGTAMANGSWSAKQGGTTLVGELGREIVVDPATGRWHTVGDNGAEFTDIPTGAIVFNHKQTEALLERGFVAGRGKALASGTAMLGGANIPVSSTTKYNSNQHRYSGSNDTSKNTAAIKEATNATEDNTKATKDSSKVYDNIARVIEVASNKAQQIADSITDYISFAKKSSLLNKQIRANNKTISVNEKAAGKYQAKADSYGLSEAWKKKIESGDWSIDELDTSTDAGKELQKQIEGYEEYYKKAQECKNSVLDLRREQEELYEQWANVPIEAYEKKLDRLNAKLDIVTAKSSASSSSTGARNLSVLKAQEKADNKRRYLNAAKSSRKKANKTLNSAKEDVREAIDDSGLSKKRQKSLLSNVSGNQKISTKGLTGNAKKEAKAYNTALKRRNKANKKVASSNKSYVKATNAVRKADASNDSYILQNQLLDEELGIETKEYRASFVAKNKTEKRAKKTDNAVDKQGNKLLKSKNLSKAQKKKIENGKTISTKGLKGKDLENAKKYNELVKKNNQALKAQANAANTAATAQANLAAKMAEVADQQMQNIQNSYESKGDLLSSQTSSASTARSLKETNGKRLSAVDYTNEANAKAAEKSNLLNEKSTLQNQLNSLVSQGKIKVGSEEWNKWQSQINSVADAAANCEADIVELNRSAQEVTLNNLDDLLAKYESAADVLSSKIEYLKSLDQDLSEKDYQDQMKSNTAEYGVQKNIRDENLALAAAERAKGNDKQAEIYEKQANQAESSMNNLLAANEELKDSMRDDIYFRQFERQRDAMNAVRNGIETIIDLIDDDMLFDKDGFITDAGLAKQAAYMDVYDSYVEDRKTAAAELARIESLKGTDGYSDLEYIEDKRAAEEKLQEAIKGEANAQKNVIDIVKKHAQAGLNATNDLIDAQKKLLQKQKEYHDFDKTIKDKSKSVQMLEQQRAALLALGDAISQEDKAELRRVEADLEDAKDDLDETFQDQIYNIRIEGLDDLKTELQEDYEKYIKDLSSNLDTISSAFDSVKGTIASAANSIDTVIQNILKHYGVENPGSLSSDANNNTNSIGRMAGFANGGVVSKLKKRIKENGDTLLASVNPGETIVPDGKIMIPENFTSKVLTDIAQKSLHEMPAFTGLSNAVPDYANLGRANKSVEVNLNYESLVSVNGDLTKSTLPDLESILTKATKKTVVELQREVGDYINND